MARACKGPSALFLQVLTPHTERCILASSIDTRAIPGKHSSVPSSFIAKKLRAPLRATGFVGITAASFAALTINEHLVASSRVDQLTDAYVQRWARTLLAIFSIQVNLHSAGPSRTDSARLVVSNHRSPADILVLVSLFGGSFLSRGDLADWPFIGRAATKARTIFVDRDNSASGVQAIRAMRQRLKEKATVIVFPEGTTFEGDEVHEFKPGAFLASQRTPCEIVPVGLAYDPGTEWKHESFMAYLRRLGATKSIRVDVCIGAPSKPDSRVQESANRYRREVATLVKEARGFAPAK
jgi:1-acyl-sn-glycerol-3-phosphate acyltransferase